MTTALSIIAKLGSKGIQLFLDDNAQLRFKAPKGALSAELKEEIVSNKAEIIRFLQQSQHSAPNIEKVSRQEGALYPLSFSQQRFYFLQQLQESDCSLNIPAALSIQGKLNIAALEQAINALAQRHEILRTIFVQQDGNVYQQVLAQFSYAIEHHDLSQTAHFEADFTQLQNDFIGTAFTLASQADKPQHLLRLLLLRRSEEQHILLLNMHHIISDGWSIRLVIQELIALYQAIVQDQAISLPEPSLHYIDYAAFQEQQWQQGRFEPQLAYWKKQLSDVPLLDFPLDFPRPKLSNRQGASIQLEFPSSTLQALKQFAAQQQSSHISVLLAAFAYLLSRYSGQNTVCIGTPVAGRKQTELENVLGCFINLLSLRQSIDSQQSFQSLLKNNQQLLLDAQEHSDIPFEKVAESLVEQRSTSFSPLFQVLLTHQQDFAQEFQVADLAIKLLNTPSLSAKYDMQLHIDERADSASLSIEYDCQLFLATTMQQFAEDFLRFLALALANSDTPLQELPLYTAQAPKPQQAESPQYKTLAINIKQPERQAIFSQGKTYSYQNLLDKVAEFRQLLSPYAIEKNDRIGILLPPSFEQMAALWAVIELGAAYVPIDTRYPAERIQLIQQQADCKLIISSQGVIANPDFNQVKPHLLRDDALLYLIFTSGSTGTPKGAGVSYANELNLLNWYIDYFQFKADDKWLVFSALGFDLTQKNLLAPMLCGAETVFPSSENYDPSALLKQISEHQITVINCAPSAFYPIVQLAARENRLEELRSLRWLLFGGEPIALENLSAFLEQPNCQVRIANMYGPTECTDITSTHILSAEDIRQQFSPIGEPINGVSTYVLDDNLQPVPVGSVGELYIGGASLGLGYFAQPELSAQAFIQSPFSQEKLYKTGDSVRYSRRHWPKPLLEFIARKDEQIKIRGYRIELAEIAHAVTAQAGMLDAKVFADEAGQRLIAYYISEHPQDIQQLRHALQQQLPDYMVPAAYIAVTEWPLSPNGKIDKRKLPKPSQEHTIQQQYLAPQNLLQQQLCQLWQEQLGIDSIGISDNFFELGGHSISAANLIAELNHRYQSDIALADFFESPSISALSLLIEQGQGLSPTASLLDTRADRTQAIPLSYAQQRLWIIEQINPGSSAYNIPFALSLKGELDKPALIQAIHSLIERHESLRTRIANDENGEPCQWIDAMPTGIHPWFIEKTECIDNQSTFNQFATTPFDLSRDALLRIELHSCSDQQHILMVNMHHIISDGWSLALMQQELSALYHAYKNQQANPLPDLSLQYADFSVWQQAFLANDEQQKHLHYWQETLADIPAAIQLPFDQARGETQSLNGAMYEAELSDALFQRLQQYSQQQGLSLFHSLLGFYALWLHKLSQQDTVCIGTPISGREHYALQQLIGYFVNAVVIRCDVDGNPSLNTFLQQIQQQSFTAFAHQDVPIEKVLESLDLERNPSFPPVAQVGFSFIGKELSQPLSLDGLSVESLDFEQQIAKYELTLIAIEQSDKLNLHIEYNSDLFQRQTISQLFGHFVHLLEQGLSQPEQSVRQLSLFNHNDLAQHLGLESQAVEGIYPLTAMQKDMVFSQWMQPNTLANTLGYRAELATLIDAGLWQQACQITCDSEPVCRTLFYANPLSYGETAWQVVLRSLYADLEVLDYRHESLSEADINQRVNQFIYRPEAYTQQQLIRYGLMRISNQRTILLLSSHHALLDGVSIVLIAQQTARHYEALSQGQSINTNANTMLMLDYLEQDAIQRDSRAVHEFWKEQFSHCEALDFPQALCSKEKRQIIKQQLLGEGLTLALKAYCRKNRLLPAHLIKLIYGLLIGDYCRAEGDFYFSEFNAGRTRYNALALGCYFEQSPFIFPASALNQQSELGQLFDYLRNYRKRIKAFDAISLGQTQKLAPHGRLHFMYNYYHFFPQQQEMQGSAIDCIEMPPLIDNTVQLVVKELERDILVDLYYQSDVFQDVDFLKRLQSLLQQIVNGKERLGDLSLLLEQDTAVLQGDKKPLSNEFSNLIGCFEQQVEQTPNAIALIDDEGELSYQQLNHAINQLADYLQQQGLQAEQRVGILLPRSRHALIAIYAVIKCGATYVPMDINYPSERLQIILDEAGIEHLLVNATTFSTSLLQENLALHNLSQFELSAFSSANPALVDNKQAALYIIFTSGSTGKPKGAAVSHANALNLLQWYISDSQFNAQSCSLIISALGFDLSQKNLFAPLLSGGTLVLSELPHYDSEKIQQLIENHKVSHINCAPSAFYPLIESHSEKLASLKFLMLGGEALQMQHLQHWLTNSQVQLKNHYGPTECTDIALSHNVQADENPIPLGKPNNNVDVFISNRFGQVLPNGLAGEICIRGKSLGLGYINDEAANQSAFIKNEQGTYYKTGDLGYIQNQLAYFVGRKDFQVKLRGLRIELGEIESALKQQATVKDALVLVANEQLIAYIITASGETDTEQIRHALARLLPSYMLPQHILPLQQWPLNSNGKIHREALPIPDATNSSVAYVAPRDEIESVICDIIQKVLNLSKVGVHDNFFDLGGHSLAASRAIVQIREHFAIDIPLSVLFEMTTVEKLANYIRAAQWALQSAAPHEDEEGRDSGVI